MYYSYRFKNYVLDGICKIRRELFSITIKSVKVMKYIEHMIFTFRKMLFIIVPEPNVLDLRS